MENSTRLGKQNQSHGLALKKTLRPISDIIGYAVINIGSDGAFINMQNAGQMFQVGTGLTLLEPYASAAGPTMNMNMDMGMGGSDCEIAVDIKVPEDWVSWTFYKPRINQERRRI